MPGLPDLALMSWLLWLLGQPDTAAERIDTPCGGPTPSPTHIRRPMRAAGLRALRLARATRRGAHAPSIASIFPKLTAFGNGVVCPPILDICNALMDTSSSSLDDVRAALESTAAPAISSASRRSIYSYAVSSCVAARSKTHSTSSSAGT